MSQEQILVPVLRQDVASYVVVGTRPLLCSKKPEIRIGKAVLSKPKDDDEAFQRARYIFESDGVEHYGFPAAGIKQSMISACAHCSAVKKHTKSRVFVKTDSGSEEFVKVYYPEGKGPYKMNTVASLTSGISVATTFARFDLWAVKFDVSFFVNTIPKEDVTLLLTIAGEMIGWGARRVETGDNRVFGTFRFAQPKEIEEIESKWSSIATI